MGKSGMGGTGKRQFAQSKLFDSPQTLKLSRVKKAPKQLIFLAVFENDQVMNWISDYTGPLHIV